MRGFYMGPKVTNAEYERWSDIFRKLMATPEFARQREAHGMYPFSQIGAELEAHVQRVVRDYRELARSFGLIR